MQRKLIPVIVLGVASVGYILARGALIGVIPNLNLWEYPVGALVVGTLLWLALRKPRAARPPPEPEWRKHAQVIRALPDAEAMRLEAPLSAWLETGERPEAAADVLATAATYEPRAREETRARLSKELAAARTRRQRETILQKQAKIDPNPGA